jgi:death-on-curing family protein
MENNSNELIKFKASGSETEVEVILDGTNETVWLSQMQMAELFGKGRTTITEHIQNVFTEGELTEEVVCRNFRHTSPHGAIEGKTQEKDVKYYNLDVIISVGYRVKSQQGTKFRKWATSKLKDYLLKGYVIDKEALARNKEKVLNLESEVNYLNQKLLDSQRDLTNGLLDIIEGYSKSFELLSKYDNDGLNSNGLTEEIIYIVNYQDVKEAITQLKADLVNKGEASNLFGHEKDDSFQGILGSISQTVFGALAYPTIEEQAAQLFYSIIKNHPFSDGNKRIGSLLFVWFLEQNKHHLKKDYTRKITDNTLVVLALAVAQSLPEQRELILKLVINLIKN